jgi:hypothetical protein
VSVRPAEVVAVTEHEVQVRASVSYEQHELFGRVKVTTIINRGEPVKAELGADGALVAPTPPVAAQQSNKVTIVKIKYEDAQHGCRNEGFDLAFPASGYGVVHYQPRAEAQPAQLIEDECSSEDPDSGCHEEQRLWDRILLI